MIVEVEEPQQSIIITALSTQWPVFNFLNLATSEPQYFNEVWKQKNWEVTVKCEKSEQQIRYLASVLIFCSCLKMLKILKWSMNHTKVKTKANARNNLKNFTNWHLTVDDVWLDIDIWHYVLKQCAINLLEKVKQLFAYFFKTKISLLVAPNY